MQKSPFQGCSIKCIYVCLYVRTTEKFFCNNLLKSEEYAFVTQNPFSRVTENPVALLIMMYIGFEHFSLKIFCYVGRKKLFEKVVTLI